MTVINAILTLAVLVLSICAIRFKPKKTWEYVLVVISVLLLSTNIITTVADNEIRSPVENEPPEVRVLGEDCYEQLRNLSDILVTLRQNADYLFPDNIIAIQEYLFGFNNNSDYPAISGKYLNLDPELIRNLYFRYRDYDEDDNMDYLLELEREFYSEKLRDIDLTPDSVELLYEGYELEVMRTYVTNREVERYYCTYEFLFDRTMSADDTITVYYVYKNTYHTAVVIFEIDNTDTVVTISLIA